MPTSRCPPSCSRRHGAAPCACPADRRRRLSAPLSVHQPGSPGRGIKDRVWAQERTTASCGTKIRNPQPVAFWTRSSAMPASTDAARGIVRANYECDSFVLRTAGFPGGSLPLTGRGPILPAMQTCVSLTLNGEDRSFDGPVSVADLLLTLGLDSRKVAVERNESIVPRS